MSDGGRIRVLVADDHPIYREGLVEAVQARDDLKLVGVCANGNDAHAKVQELRPDVAILDLQMPGLTGLDLVRVLHQDSPGTRCLLLSGHAQGALAYDAVTAGAAGFLSKDCERETICDAVAAAARGERVISDDLRSSLLDQVEERQVPAQPSLTPRELEILELVAKGESARGIGKLMHLSETTVKSHLRNLYEKLGVSERAAAVAEAMRRGLLR